MVKVLSPRLQQCLGAFPMLLIEGSSETGFFRYSSNHLFGVCSFGNTLAMMVIFFLKMFKI